MKEFAAVVGLICTVIGTLLALGVIHPLGGAKPANAIVVTTSGGNNAGSTLTFPTVSSGGSSSKVPDVRGESLDQAEQELRAAGYTNLTRDETFTDDSSLVGKVVQTGPPDGWSWPTDEQIRIFIGKPIG